MKFASLLVLLFVCGLSLVGCRSSKKDQAKVRLVHGVIEVDRGVEASALQKGILGIGRQSQAAVVRSVLGAPFAKVQSERDTCWAYHAHQPGTSIDALDFCITPQQRVGRILIGEHG